MRRVIDPLLRVFSSFGLSCVLLILLALLTWLGTLEQVDHGLFEVQQKYFNSFFLVHRMGPVSIPLPGANLVLCLLFVNLVTGGIVRMRRGWSMAGVLIIHVGILLMLFSGFVKYYFSNDGHMTLYENERANLFQSYYRWEISMSRELGDGRIEEHLVPQEDFTDALGPRPVTFTSQDLPFELQLSYYMPNCLPRPKGPMSAVAVPVVDGAFLEARTKSSTAEANIAGAYVAVVDRQTGARTEGILWGRDEYPLVVAAGGDEWAIDLRKERYPLPFMITLDLFTKADHPRTSMPSVFSSDVTVTEGASSRPVKISMNEPLRDKGYVLYQASWGPSNAHPGDPLFSTLSVVQNPADQYPLYACIIIAVGLVVHFSRKLTRYMRAEASR